MNTNSEKYAHYFAGGGRKYVAISKGPSPRNTVKTIDVGSKLEAREVAGLNNATPWNF